MRKILALIAISSLIVFALMTPCTAMPPIPPEIKSVVAFVFVPPTKAGRIIPNGTGFFIAVKVSEEPKTYSVYFVTAKHVLQRRNEKSFFPGVSIRLNTLDGKTDMFPLMLFPDGPNKNVFIHNDPTVDLAVIPALPDTQKYDFKYLPDHYITTKEDFKELSIREGSEVFFTGLFLPHIGEQRNYPIARFGRVALITDEKVAWEEGVKAELILIESSSYGGNSGSPVYFYFGIEREPGVLLVGQPVLKLAGVIKGFFGERQPVQIVETVQVPVTTSNLGISAVVPAYKLHEILYGKELKDFRNRMKN